MAAIAQTNLTRWVDPFIGSAGHGHVFVGANVPYGAVQLGPVNLAKGWDWCSGYNYADSVIIGFAHTHLSGTGIGDLGDILLMPVTGPTPVKPGSAGNWQQGYGSLFRHAQEISRPGYYAVTLQRYGIRAELTATERVGFHQYTFPASGQAGIVIDLEQGIGDRATATSLTRINDSTLAGYRYSRGWAKDQRIYFTAIFSKPFRQLQLFEDSLLQTGTALTGQRVKAVVTFETQANEKLLVKVGISPVSADNALLNIRAEMPGWDFMAVATSAGNAWNDALNRVQVTMHDTTQLRTFYTALYHTMIAPSIFNDHNGDYPGADKKIYSRAAFVNHTTFSLWDTYRAAQPLLTLLHPEKVNDLINSLLQIYRQQGKLPIWHLVGNETNTMPGNSAIPVVADAFLKGFTGFDAQLAYEAAKATALRNERGLPWVKQYGFIPADSMVESVAMGLEYCIDDWCLAQMAQKLNKPADYQYFMQRAANYKNYFDRTVGFMRGRVSATEWRTPFSPFAARHMKDDFCEGNAWQYTWLVPHDVEGLMNIMGGEKAFRNKLDSLFTTQGDMGKEASNDITGLIGQYAHGNEPSHHITYLYAFAGQPWKTAGKVRYIMDSLYKDNPDGLCGNEDVGQLSAWYVFSALGFYPVNPANGMYVFGSPLVNNATFHFQQGITLQVQVRNNSRQNCYIQRITWNGKPYTKSYILHRDLLKGGVLLIDMGNQPSAWGTRPADRPYSMLRTK